MGKAIGIIQIIFSIIILIVAVAEISIISFQSGKIDAMAASLGPKGAPIVTAANTVIYQTILFDILFVIAAVLLLLQGIANVRAGKPSSFYH